METRQKRHEQALKQPAGQIFTPKYHKILQETTRAARSCIARRGPEYTAMVEQRDEPGLRHVVDLRARTCTCHEFQLRLLPCKHAIATIAAFQQDLASYVPQEFTYQQWELAYRYNFVPVPFRAPLPDDTARLRGTVHDVTPGAIALLPINCHPPTGQFEQAIGKRKKARAVAGQRASRASGRTEQKCGNCGGLGHKKGRCVVRTHK
jgi:hypothetical protein